MSENASDFLQIQTRIQTFALICLKVRLILHQFRQEFRHSWMAVLLARKMRYNQTRKKDAACIRSVEHVTTLGAGVPKDKREVSEVRNTGLQSVRLE
jgi:hypothetical protein